LNIRGAVNKLEEFQLILSELCLNPYFVCFSEHWATLDTIMSLNKLDGFTLLDSYCREKKMGGGVCIMGRNLNTFKSRIDINMLGKDSVFECVAVETGGINNLFHNKLVIINIYRAPGSDIWGFFNYFEQMLNVIRKDLPRKKVFICGDFNINILESNTHSLRFRGLIESAGLSFVFGEPTRITKDSSTCIDNIITNYCSTFYHGEIIELGLSDHTSQVLFTTPKNCVKKVRNVSKKRIYSPDNVAEFCRLLSNEKWESCMQDSSCNGSLNKFACTFYNCFNAAFPLRIIKSVYDSSKHSKDWMTVGLKISCKNKRDLYELSKVIEDPSFHDYYKKYTKILKRTIIAAKKLCNFNKIKRSTNLANASWKIIRSELGKKRKYTTCSEIVVNETTIEDPQIIANCFNRVFIEAGACGDKTSSLEEAIRMTHKSCSTIECKNSFKFNLVDEQHVLKMIRKLKNKLSSGWDNISSLAIKPAAQFIVKPLTHVINNSLKHGIFPDQFKFALINPVYKKGDSRDPSNYRPVALLPVLSKIIEGVVLEQLTRYFEENNLLSSCQYGFRKNRMTRCAIYDLVSQVIEGLDSSVEVAGVFCDLSSAFDCVDHRILLSKLEQYGVNGIAHDWFKSYLTGRYQQVGIKGENSDTFFSEWRQITQGVPQGSKLGPFLFLIYVNDLFTNVRANVVSFADDISAVIKAPNINALNYKCKDVFEELLYWTKINGLKLNASKSVILHFQTSQMISRRKKEITSITLQGSHGVDVSEKTRFLGVHIQNRMKWEDHLEHLYVGLSRSIFAVSSIRKVSNKEVSLMVYHGYFMSLARYGIVFWGMSPGFQNIFRLQKRAVRVIVGASPRTSCRTIFKELRLLPLPAVYIVEIAMLVRSSFQTFYSRNNKHQYSTRNSEVLLQYPRHRLTLLEKSPLYMGIKIYNKLPSSLKSVTTHKQFKKGLIEILVNLCPYSVEEFLAHTY
jgi:hypothetical protein